MNKLSTAERSQIISMLVEGNSVNSIVRMTGRSNNTVLKLLRDIGEACQKFHDEKVRGLACKRIQCDEIWNYCYAKEKNVPADKKGIHGFGDVWTWTAIDADTKLMVSWLVGQRNGVWARRFMMDVADRLLHRVQLTTDGLTAYLDATYTAFGNDIDYAQLVKIYGKDGVQGGASGRYSPPALLSIEQKIHCGNPEQKHISTSFVERSNLTWRMTMRRFTRLTNGFSKKLENMEHAVALTFTFYNFCRIHKTLRVTPAMEAGLTDHVWEISELVALLD